MGLQARRHPSAHLLFAGSVSEEAPAALLGGVWELWWTIVFTALAAFALVVTLASSPGRLIARSVGQAAQRSDHFGRVEGNLTTIFARLQLIITRLQ